MSEQPLSLDELRKTRAELVALSQLGVEHGYDRAVRTVDGLLADLDAAERVFHRLNGQEQLLEGAEKAIWREQEIVDEMKEHPVLTRQRQRRVLPHIMLNAIASGPKRKPKTSGSGSMCVRWTVK